MADRKEVGDASLTPIQHMISSCSGAFLTSVFVTPLDVVKIRMQAQSKPQAFTKGNCYLYCNGLMDHTCICLNGSATGSLPLNKKTWYNRPGNFNGIFDAFFHIGRNEGLASLWSGLPPTLVMAVPATVVYFTTYEQVKAMLGHSYSNPGKTWWVPMLAGSGARVFAASVISPLELIRTKMQSEQLTYREIHQAVSKTVSQDGVLSLWRGLSPTLLRDVPFSALYWFSYEMMKTRVMRERQSTKLTFAESFVSGACSGTIAGIVTLPFDVIKTHRQIELGEVVFGKGKKEVSSTWRLIQNLYRQQGIQALFSGLAPRVLKVAPACAIMISTFEHCKDYFRQRNLELVDDR